jgi:hypothetical protein
MVNETTYDEGKIAEKRGKRAKKLFDKNVMGDVIKACKMHDANETGAFDVFDGAVRGATSAEEEGLTEADFTAFIQDMWVAANASRAQQENRPCW